MNVLLNEDEGLSVHYLIDRSGICWQSVDLVRAAWHAGVSQMPDPDGRESVNVFSVGVELLGDEEPGFTRAQYQTLVELIADELDEIPLRNIVGHNDITTIREPDKQKTDPWGFNWSRLEGMLQGRLPADRFGRLEMVGGPVSRPNRYLRTG